MVWIRIRIYLAVLDLDPYWECKSGSRSMEIDQNLQINTVSFLSTRLFAPSQVCFWPITNFKSIFFNLKIQLFVTFKSHQDPDPLWFGSLSVRIRMQINIEIKARSRSALKLMRIHNTAGELCSTLPSPDPRTFWVWPPGWPHWLPHYKLTCKADRCCTKRIKL